MKEQAFSYLGSKAWANQHLKYGISICQCKSGMIATREGYLQTVLMLKDDLESFGYTWQVRILEYWIHRLQARKPDSQKEKERDFIE